MKIFVEKFGGASVNSSMAVKNVASILKMEKKRRLVVISAMGKTTNKLENIVNSWFNDKTFNEEQYNELRNYHKNIIKELFNDDSTKYENIIENIFCELNQKIKTINHKDYNFLYDSIVSYGEKISTTIVSSYLNYIGIKNTLVSSCEIIKTDYNYRDANVCWNDTQQAINDILMPIVETNDLTITQGFVAGTRENIPTTLGREGSDYSAAILAFCLKAQSMTIWKDVPGLLNADPKRLQHTTKLVSVPYSEAIELSYYGATIIHPKTIKPLENLSIPLYIKSFVNPDEEGSVICKQEKIRPVVANYIFKDNQILLSIFPKDFSFIAEKNISSIFAILANNKVKVNLMQNSAISFSVCFDENKNLLPQILNDLKQQYSVLYNTNLQLVTIRHYTQKAIDEIIDKKNVIIEQKSRVTAQFLISKTKE